MGHPTHHMPVVHTSTIKLVCWLNLPAWCACETFHSSMTDWHDARLQASLCRAATRCAPRCIRQRACTCSCPLCSPCLMACPHQLCASFSSLRRRTGRVGQSRRLSCRPRLARCTVHRMNRERHRKHCRVRPLTARALQPRTRQLSYPMRWRMTRLRPARAHQLAMS